MSTTEHQRTGAIERIDLRQRLAAADAGQHGKQDQQGKERSQGDSAVRILMRTGRSGCTSPDAGRNASNPIKPATTMIATWLQTKGSSKTALAAAA